MDALLHRRVVHGSSTRSSPVVLQPVRGLTDALRMRTIRNEVRLSLTHDTSWISWVRQVWWYYNTYRLATVDGRLQAYLVWHDQSPVGYGLLRVDGNKCWITGALIEAVRGQGYGRLLFDALTFMARAWGEPWLDVRRDNHVARSLYARLGFRVTEERGDILVMTCP